MPLKAKRGYARHYRQAAIQIEGKDTCQYASGCMRNCSVNGMFFLSEVPLSPGANIRIQVVSKNCDLPMAGLLDNQKAKVVWCLKKKEMISCYEVGVQFRRPVQ